MCTNRLLGLPHVRSTRFSPLSARDLPLAGHRRQANTRFGAARAAHVGTPTRARGPCAALVLCQERPGRVRPAPVGSPAAGQATPAGFPLSPGTVPVPSAPSAASPGPPTDRRAHRAAASGCSPWRATGPGPSTRSRRSAAAVCPPRDPAPPAAGRARPSSVGLFPASAARDDRAESGRSRRGPGNRGRCPSLPLAAQGRRVRDRAPRGPPGSAPALCPRTRGSRTSINAISRRRAASTTRRITRSQHHAETVRGRVLRETQPLPLQVPRRSLPFRVPPATDRRRPRTLGALATQHDRDIHPRAAPMPAIGPGNGVKSAFPAPPAQGPHMDPPAPATPLVGQPPATRQTPHNP